MHATLRRCMLNLVSKTHLTFNFFPYTDICTIPPICLVYSLKYSLFLHPDSFIKLQFQYNPFFIVPEAELHSSLALFPYLVSCFVTPIILLHSNCLKHIYKPSPTVSCFLLYHYRTDLYHPMKLFLRYIQLVQKA